MHRAVLSCFLVAALSLITSRARSQIVNVQPLVAGGDHDGFSGAIEGSADARKGNSNLLLLSGSAVLRYRTGPSLAFALASIDYGEHDDKRFISKNLEHFRYRFAIDPPFELEAFAQHENDAFRRISARGLFGAGPRLHFEIESMDLALGAAVMFDLEDLANDGLPDANATSTHVRISTYLSYALSMNDHLKLGYTLYFQPRSDEPKDYRVLSETALTATAVKHLSIKLALALAYDSSPPISVKPLDTSRKASLQLTF